MKASEVTESGFYWWYDSDGWFSDRIRGPWHVIEWVQYPGQNWGWWAMAGTEIANEVDGDVYGPVRPPIEGEGNEA